MRPRMSSACQVHLPTRWTRSELGRACSASPGRSLLSIRSPGPGMILETTRVRLSATWRGAAATAARTYSSDDAQKTSFPDPERPDLFYHLVEAPWPPPGPGSDERVPLFALSFLDTPPPRPDSSTVIGWLPALAQTEGAQAKLGDFVENRE